jgi:hypothetical protein
MVSIELEVNLRVPSLTMREEGQQDRRIQNASVRFARRIQVDRVPKRDETLSASAWGTPFDCTVTRCDWSDEKNVLVASCVFGRRTITQVEYEALLTDPAWTKHELPA